MAWRYRHTVLTLCTLAFFATMVARLGISPIVPEIVDEFEISNTHIGVALTGMWIAYALSQFPSGVLADRFGEKRIVIVAVGGTALAVLLISFSPVFIIFITATILLGLVAGLHYTAATTLLTRTFEDTGTAVGIHTTGSPLAGLIAPILVAWIAIRAGWRPAIAVAALIAIPIAILFAVRVRRTPPQRPDEPMRDQLRVGSMTRVLYRPPIAFTVVLTVISLFIWQGNASFLPTFLIDHRGLTSTMAAVVFSINFVVQGIGLVIVGAFSDRFGRDPAIAGCMICGIIGYSLFIAVPGWVAIGVGVILLGIGLSFSAALFPRFLDQFTPAEQNIGFGLVRTVSGVLGATGSFMVGFLADLFGWVVSFGTLVVLMVVALLLLLINWLFQFEY